VPTTRYPITSSWPQYVGLKDGQLYIVFSNGDCALFPQFGEAMLNFILLADSPGGLINRMLKQWPYQKVAIPEVEEGGGG
jgi:hypothetical protein